MPAWVMWTSVGSSPRPWGTLEANTPETAARRFIPTPVGNTRKVCNGDHDVAVHPHARGEHPFVPWKGALGFGSSPRPWGTRTLTWRSLATGRFIPTPVGNTSGAGGILTRASVHPHARGEHAWALICVLVLSGSSPRPWGTLERVQHQALHGRFIPTPVGNTG